MALDFAKHLMQWYNTNKRHLPWRLTNDPYAVWVSEIILQQTRVDQGMAYYQRFMKAWPNVSALAKASEDDVLKLWQGLGYYSRARNMHATAKLIVQNFNGSFPSDYNTIKSLKGIGSYTAAAIASIAFGQTFPAVDGNVQRVLSRVFGVLEAVDGKTGKKQIDDLSWQHIDNEDPGNYNQAVMEFGALQCLPANPQCGQCIFRESCYALLNGLTASLPRKQKKPTQKIRYFNYIWMRWQSRNQSWVALDKRLHNDIWKGLYEFPMIETAKPVHFDEITLLPAFQQLVQNNRFNIRAQSAPVTHQLTHQKIIAKFFHLNFETPLDLMKENKLSLINQSEIGNYPISRLIDRYLQQNEF